MATYISAAANPAAPVYKYCSRGEEAVGTIDLTAALILADVIHLCRVPAGATVYDGVIVGGDIDTGTGVFAITVGWLANGVEAVNAAGFLASNVLNGTAGVHVGSVAGIRIPFQGVLITTGPQFFTRETVITATVAVAPNAGGTGRLNAYVKYYAQ